MILYKQKSTTQQIFFFTIFVSLLHSFFIFDYNNFLLVLMLYAWIAHKSTRLSIFLFLNCTIIIDILYLIYYTKTYELKNEFIFKKKNVNWGRYRLLLIRINYSLEILGKLSIIMWILFK